MCATFAGHAQSGFREVDDWLADNAAKMGGRAILVVYKDGKIVYSHADNEMSRRQKAVGKILARRQGTAANTSDYDADTRQQIAGAILEKISGKNFETLFAERIAGPLDMRNTDFGKGKVALPAGGASSTPDDYLNFLSMILNKGMYKGRRILSENSVAAMQVNQLGKDTKIAYSPAEAGNFGYGFGEWVMETSSISNLSKTVTSPGLFGSFPWVDNEKKYAAFLMCFYLKSEGRNERYKELKGLVDKAVR